MPRVLHFERDLVRINITRKCHQLITARKGYQEPLYRVVDRILTTYLNNDAADWQDMYYQQIESTKNWKKRYEDLKEFTDKQLLNKQTKLI